MTSGRAFLDLVADPESEHPQGRLLLGVPCFDEPAAGCCSP